MAAPLLEFIQYIIQGHVGGDPANKHPSDESNFSGELCPENRVGPNMETSGSFGWRPHSLASPSRHGLSEGS